MTLAVLAAATAVAAGAASHFRQRVEQARTALDDGQAQLGRGDWDGAVHTLRRGLSVARGTPFQQGLADELACRLRRAEQARAAADRAAAARELRQLADRVRFVQGADRLPPGDLCGLAACCRALWENRARVVERLGSQRSEPAVRDDLLDLAIFGADLQVRLAPPDGKEQARRQARTVLDEAEALLGPSPVLDEERRCHGGPGRGGRAPGTAWERCALGRSYLRAGDLDRAAGELARAVRLEPQGLWPNFYQGLCAYRQGRYVDAVAAYSVCIGAAPEAANCFHNRALAFTALGRPEQALRDYDQALRLDPTLAAAALNRGMLHYRAGRSDGALADLRRARELGADPALVSFDLALVHTARGEHAAALDELVRARRAGFEHSAPGRGPDSR
jgi:tetratricopeptide (TPR) repeat protein